MIWLGVVLAGGVGAVLRFVVDRAVARRAARSFPFGTLAVNISGAALLGLLGTVIGVMITFAVIAKSGQVEVNSIAPGIAGALLATVAGLAVAIPCLFSYSYISTRIKDAIIDMQIFIDEFIAKVAEFYPETYGEETTFSGH